ncbi:MAG: DUF364 domain-containing protein [Candidatus Eisenbacteria bacterium]
MAIIETLLDELGSLDAPVREVRLCLRTCAVWSRRLGLAYSFPRDPSSHGDGDPIHRPAPAEPAPAAAPHPQRLRDCSARRLAELARSADREQAAVGIAAINSLIEPPPALSDEHALDVILRYGRARDIVLVGHFPFIDRLRAQARALTVLELLPREGDLPAAEAPRVIPAADVVAITATTLINHTLEGLLDLARGKPVILLGPTAPLTPALLAHGITAVCGSVVVEPEETLRDVSEGVSFRRMRGLRRVVLER